MDIVGVPFAICDFQALPPAHHDGQSAEAIWRTIEVGNLRVRVVEYAPGYVADHWCSRGHVLYVLDGAFVTELQDGRCYTLSRGMGYQVASGAPAHRSSSATGARLFIVD